MCEKKDVLKLASAVWPLPRDHFLNDEFFI